MANHYDFEGRVALVTGGASGIGAATVERLRLGGADVRVFDLAAGDDVRDPDLLRAAVAELPRLDILVCAAGVFGKQYRTVDVPDEHWRRVHAVNLDGLFYSIRAAIPKMLENGYGRIVNVASVGGKEGNPLAAAYCSSKGAAIALTKSVAKDLIDTGILVNSVAPAVIDTPLLEQMTPDHVAYMTERVPLGRPGTSDEVALLVCWLASEDMTFSTGACFDVSGGRASF